jgi:quercetin dioxygenase-like cupin family protein
MKNSFYLLTTVCICACAVRAADDRVKIDNDQVRILFVTSPQDAKSELHSHKMNRVMIYLDAGKMTLTEPSGKIETLNFKAGEALWSPAAGPHISRNVSDHPVRIVEVELKSSPGSAASQKSAPLDWVKVDNDQVRVVRARYAPHEKGVLHEHPYNYAVVFLTDCKLQVTPVDGEPRTASKSAGEITWGTASKHTEENLNDKPLEVLVIEFKY